MLTVSIKGFLLLERPVLEGHVVCEIYLIII